MLFRSSNPQKDYKDWIKSFEDVMNKSSDLPFNFKISVPDHYYMLPNSLKSYDIGYKHWESHEFTKAVQPGVMKLVQDVVTLADPEIDFSKANHIWIVPPPTAKRKDLISWDLYNYNIQLRAYNLSPLLPFQLPTNDIDADFNKIVIKRKIINFFPQYLLKCYVDITEKFGMRCVKVAYFR